MNRYVLEQEVHICGRDFFGREASVILRPTREKGWYWQADNEVVPLSPAILTRKWRRLALTHKGAELNVFEHLGALRFTGLDNVLIVSATNWLPHDGSAAIFWDACKPHVRSAGTLVGQQMTPQQRFEGDRSLRYSHYCGEVLVVHVAVDYPSLGQGKAYGAFPSIAEFESIASVRTQGWPRWSRNAAIVAGWCGWPHRHNSVWPQEHPAADTSRHFAQHRMIDLLGALSVACPPGGMMTGAIRSRCAGHALDAAFVRQLEPYTIAIAA